jgi:hypothetical protein
MLEKVSTLLFRIFALVNNIMFVFCKIDMR